jgi:large subunit ribosomal protein L35
MAGVFAAGGIGRGALVLFQPEEPNMPKMKTNRSAHKRFKLTASGKIRRYKAYARHILTTKTTKQKRGLRLKALVDATNLAAVRKLIPYKS